MCAIPHIKCLISRETFKMERKGFVIIVLLFVRFKLVHNCDCKFVDILRNIVQREIMDREILTSRMEMLESKFAKGITKDADTSESLPGKKMVLERCTCIITNIL